jgi:hypothetical protein
MKKTLQKLQKKYKTLKNNKKICDREQKLQKKYKTLKNNKKISDRVKVTAQGGLNVYICRLV